MMHSFSIFVALVLAAQLAALWFFAKHRNPFFIALLSAASIVAVYLLITAELTHGPGALEIHPPQEAPGATPAWTVKPMPGPGSEQEKGPAEWFAQRDADLYAPEWKVSKVVTRPLRPQAGPVKPRFVQRTDVFSGIKNDIASLDLLGAGTAYYAGVAVGDLNQDGFLDVMLAHPGAPVSVMLNDRQGGFSPAPEGLFAGGTPYNAEWVSLADVNSDSYLDLLVIASQYGGPRRNILYLFDPKQNRFVDSGLDIGRGKRMAGGVSFTDLNRDGKLDFYVSFGVDWESDDVNFLARPSQDEFFLSGPEGWRESLGDVFPKDIFNTPYVGMTALFVDADRDGHTDFLLGNDMLDPSVTLFGGDNGAWTPAGPAKIERNTINSMSYFPMDVDNDGVFELWENGTGLSTRLMEQTSKADGSTLAPTLRAGELSELHRQFSTVYQDANLLNRHRAFKCDGFVDEAVRSLCWDWRMAELAWDSGDVRNCNRVVSRFMAAFCRRNYAVTAGLGASNSIGVGAARSKNRLGLERFPLQDESNVLLKRTETGVYRDLARQMGSLAHTGWSWCAFPFDVDNDGHIDLYLGTGYLEWSHDVNRLLFNRSGEKGIAFVRGESDWGVDFEDETRGVAIADFDHDGDGDLVLNNYLSPPRYLENQAGGRGLQVELRSHANYYGIGSTMELHTNRGIQTRTVTHGGIWDSAPPLQQHFGLAPGEEIQNLTITWPHGEKQTITGFEAGNLYVVYE